MIQALGIGVALSLTMSMFVETSTWWLRAEARPGMIGRFVSRTNIYLYGGRFFALTFASTISLLVDRSFQTSSIILLLSLSFAIVTITHIVLLLGGRSTAFIVKEFGRILKFPVDEKKIISCVGGNALILPTMLSSLCFSLGLSVPYVLASIFPAYRLTIANLGQIINSFGTFMLLFYVDQALFAALDHGTIGVDVRRYAKGRAAGFGAASLLLGVLYVVWRSHG